MMNPYLILLIAWFFPGAGHVIQKRYLKAAVFFSGIVLLLALGLVMQGKFYDTRTFHPLMILGFFGDLGNGFFYFLVNLLGLGRGNIEAVTFHFGTTYLAVAGLLNFLVALNAFDIARGRRS